MEKNIPRENRVRGALYGFAIGDAMGVATRFMDAEGIRKLYGVVDTYLGDGWMHMKPGKVTWNTKSMVSVMDALEDSTEVGFGFGNFEELLVNNLYKLEKDEYENMDKQTMAGIIYRVNMGYPYSIDEGDKVTAGGLVRALPCALLGNLELNLVQNRVTHSNRRCVMYIGRYHNAVRRCLGHGWPYRNLGTKSAPLMKQTSDLKNVYTNAMNYATATSSFEETIINAVNAGGDSCAVAAIAGSIAGARFGYEDIPDRWVEPLDEKVKVSLDRFSRRCESAFG